MLPHAALLLLGINIPSGFAQTWCGKHYKKTLPVTEPGGEFPTPSTSTTPLLALRCSPAIRPYLAEDAQFPESNDVAILIDSPITFFNISNAAPISERIGARDLLSVTVSVDGNVLTSGSVPVNTTAQPLAFSLTRSFLSPPSQVYTISCSATINSQTFHAIGSLSYLPNPPSNIGSVTKMDLRTGTLLARPADGKGGAYQLVFPVGFYTAFGNYLAQNSSIPAELAASGLNVVHIIPPFSNLTQLDLILDKMQEAGLYLMYDMRGTYMNTTSVTEQVRSIQSRPNLLLWYTADEPDGTSDPLDATLNAYNLITSLDGGDGLGGAGYHPVSLVLNCENYYFSEYTRGADIVMQDTYMIGNNVSFSTVWGTVCTDKYGDCGCDNCKGTFDDISNRMDEFSSRLYVNGWERTKAVWAVPQAFGSQTYWPRYPTPNELLVQSILSIIRGGRGIIPWMDPVPPSLPSGLNLRDTLGMMGKAMRDDMGRFILDPSAQPGGAFLRKRPGGVEVGIWTLGRERLILATNTAYSAASVSWSDLGFGARFVMRQVMTLGSWIDAMDGRLAFDSVGSGAFVVKQS